MGRGMLLFLSAFSFPLPPLTHPFNMTPHTRFSNMTPFSHLYNMTPLTHPFDSLLAMMIMMLTMVLLDLHAV